MRYPLPYKDFRWMTEQEISSFNPLTQISETNGKGYVLEVDLEYPPEIHRKHNSFPLAPQNETITKAKLSPTSKEYLEKLPHLKGNYKTQKLTATFEPR